MKTKLIIVLLVIANISLFAYPKVIDVHFLGDEDFRITVYNLDIDDDGKAEISVTYINDEFHDWDWISKTKESMELDIIDKEFNISCNNKILTINLGKMFSNNGNIKIDLYDIKGSKISNIYNGAYSENIQNSTDVPKGMYLAVLLIDDNVITKKIIIK